MKKFKKLALSIVSLLMAVTCVSGVFAMSDVSADAATASHKHTYPETYTDDQIELQPDCKKKGYARVECTDEDCTKTKKIYIDKLEHTRPTDAAQIEHEDASCKKKGYDRFKCTECGKKVKVTIDKTEHEFVEGAEVEVKEATCTTRGYTKAECKVCGKEKKNYTDKLGHEWTKNVDESKDATCTKDGELVEFCNRADCDAERSKNVEKLGHDLEITTTATCKDGGKETATCKRCDYEKVTKVKALGHDWVKTKEVPDCTDGPHKDYYKCKVCEKHSHTASDDKKICNKDDMWVDGEGHKYDAKGKCEYKGCKVKLEGLYYIVGEYAYPTLEEAKAVAGERGVISYAMNGDAALSEMIFVGKDAKFDGNKNVLDASNVKSGSDCAITTLGGKIQKVTVNGAGRAIGTGSSGTYALADDLLINKVTIDGGTYAINIGNGNGYDMDVKSSTLYGWISYSGLAQAEFNKCTFGQGNTEYAYVRMYDDTKFVNCDFEEGFKIGANEAGLTIELSKCYYGNVKITAENFVSLLTVAGDEDTEMLKKCTIKVDGKVVGQIGPQANVEVLEGAFEANLYDLSNNFSVTGETAVLETAYVFSAMDTPEEAQASEYANWIADYYVSVDKDVAAGTIGLAGSYDSWNDGEWIGFYSPIDLKAGQEIGLLESTGGRPWTYAEIVEGVRVFRCGAFDLNDACVGVTLKVELRLTNPDDATKKITVCVTEYTFEASEVSDAE